MADVADGRGNGGQKDLGEISISSQKIPAKDGVFYFYPILVFR